MLKYYEQKQGQKEIKKAGKSKLFNRHIFSSQFSLNFKSLLIWSIIVAAIMAMVLAIYPLVEEMMAELLASDPDGSIAALLEVFGGGSVENIGEYYVVEGGQMYVLVGVIFAAMLGINLIRKEIADGSAEYIYSQPVSKGAIFRSKLLVFVTNIFMFNILVSSVSFTTMIIVDNGVNFDVSNFLVYSLLATTIHLMVGLIAFSLTAIFKKKVSIGLGIGVGVGTYFISLISKLATDVEYLKNFTPFTLIYGKTEGATNLTVMADGFKSVEMPILIGWAALTVVLLAYSHFYFKRNDIIT